MNSKNQEKTSKLEWRTVTFLVALSGIGVYSSLIHSFFSGVYVCFGSFCFAFWIIKVYKDSQNLLKRVEKGSFENKKVFL
jgi:hypothetical protein